MAALREFSELRKEAVKEQAASFFSMTGGLVPITSFGLPPGLHVFSPPFDLDQPGSTYGSPVESHATHDTGEIFVNAP